MSRPPLPPDEEPFLIFANRYYLRKLNLDGSNYTLLKQVPDPPSSPRCLPRPTATSLTQYSPPFSALGPMAIPPLTSPAVHVLTLRSPLCSPPKPRASTTLSPWTLTTESR